MNDDTAPPSDKPIRSESRRPSSKSRVVAGMSSVTLLSILLGFITSPIQARALGPIGRGDLAAIAVVLGIAPTLLDFGLAGFVARERARGTDAGSLYATILALTAPFCLIGVALAIPVGHLIGHGRPVVTHFVELGLWLSPLGVMFQTVGLVAVAERRWGLINRLRLTPPFATAVSFVVLYALGRLTVASASIVLIASGLVAGAQLLPLLIRTRGWSFHRSLVRPALRFGSRVWITTILAQGNSYLDQLMLIGLTSARQLGLYAVATTVSSVALPIIVAPLAAGTFGDAATGRYDDVAPACRAGLLGTLACGLVIAVAGPLAISVVFGKAFDGAIAMVFLLLLSSLPASVSGIIATLLGAAGQPGQVLRAQAVGLAVSVPLLAIAIPHFGGLGAAAVDNITNLTVAAVVLRYAIGTFGGRATDYTVPRSSDVRKLWSSLLGMLRRLSTA